MPRYDLNKFIHVLQFPENRARYDADPEGFLGEFGLSREEVQAVLSADIRTLWMKGANPYLLRVFQFWNQISDADFEKALEGFSFLESIRPGGTHG
ncbi:MAG: hypothetical protein O2807_00990 [bacterium]|nr:hypothetical protein [bacterium]